MCPVSAKNAVVFQEARQSHRDDHVFHLRVQSLQESLTCLGPPKRKKKSRHLLRSKKIFIRNYLRNNAAKKGESSEETLVLARSGFHLGSGVFDLDREETVLFRGNLLEMPLN